MVSTERGEGERDEQATTVRGVSVWRVARQAETVESNTRDQLRLGDDSSRWEVHPVGGEGKVVPIESASPAVRGFFRRVVAEKVRIARSGMTRPPVPKPAPKPAPAVPAHAPVPCPLCRPNATSEHPGEPWPDCELCNGEGVVP